MLWKGKLIHMHVCIDDDGSFFETCYRHVADLSEIGFSLVDSLIVISDKRVSILRYLS